MIFLNNKAFIYFYFTTVVTRKIITIKYTIKSLNKILKHLRTIRLHKKAKPTRETIYNKMKVCTERNKLKWSYKCTIEMKGNIDKIMLLTDVKSWSYKCYH